MIREIIGDHSLGLASAATASDAGQLLLRLLVRLKILFDCQRSHFVLRDFSEPRPDLTDSLPGQDFCFQAAVYVLHVGTKIHAPQLLGSSDYALLRGGVFSAFLAVFRVLCLHDTPTTPEQGVTLRRMIDELCTAWAYYQPLSDIEKLVLKLLVTSTLDEIQDQNEACDLRRVACARYDSMKYHQGLVSGTNGGGRAVTLTRCLQTPFCVDPSRQEYREKSLKSCRGCFKATMETLSVHNYVAAFWILQDASWAVMDATIKRGADDAEEPSVKSLGEKLVTAICEKSQSIQPESESHGHAICNYFGDSVAHLLGNSEILVRCAWRVFTGRWC